MAEQGRLPERIRKDTPIDRLYRAGTITHEQFWCAEEFAHLYQAASFGPGVPAVDYQRDKVQTSGVSGRQVQAVEDIADYEQALMELNKEDRRQRRLRCLAPVLISAACLGTPLAVIDKDVEKRKQWAKDIVVQALQVLERLWKNRIKERRAVLATGPRSPRSWQPAA